MSKVTLYIASSIDGYIATKDGGVDWLSIAESGDEDYGYNEFYKNIDALIMGRKTYDFCNQFDKWPYEGKQCYVFTKRSLTTKRNNATFLSSDVKEAVNKIKSAGHNNIWLVGGGVLNTEFFNNNLIDEIILSVIPIVLGDGIPLFPEAQHHKLNLISSKNYPSGLVQIVYKVK